MVEILLGPALVSVKGCTLDESLVDALDTMKDCALDERSENKLGLLRGEVTDCTLDERSEIVLEKQWEREDFVKETYSGKVKALALDTLHVKNWIPNLIKYCFLHVKKIYLEVVHVGNLKVQKIKYRRGWYNW